MKNKILLACLWLFAPLFANSQSVKDDFEGNGNITTWKGDDCAMNTNLQNPVKNTANNSNTVMEYFDKGGLYANIRFDLNKNFDLSTAYVFTLKIYIPSNKLSGKQTNQVSLKLQDGSIAEPWSTQSEIIKPLLLDQWQTVSFDFVNDNFKNLNSGSLPPSKRKDFNRVVIQINGENNRDTVQAFIDDFSYLKSSAPTSIYTQLVWSDEFETAGALNSNNWFHQTQLPNSGSWFNGEIQHYTNRTQNSVVENGILKVIAKKENFTDQGVTKQFTSARLNSKFAFKYGRVEFRAKLPSGVGTWPAVWMLAKNIDENGAYWDNLGFGNTAWPACGEIDILEHWGHNQNYVQSATHTSSSFGNTVNLGGQVIPTASSEFHMYAMEWSPEKLVFSVDSNVHYTYQPSVKNNNTWPFDAEQYLLINFAIQSNISPSFSQGALEIDYIRVFQEKTTSSVADFSKGTQPIFYPNPFTNFLYVKTASTNISAVAVQIYSAAGHLVISNTYKIENNVIFIPNLESLSTGVYYLSYQLDGKNERIKIVK